MATSPRTSTPSFTPVRRFLRAEVEDLLKLQRAAEEISSILDLDLLVDRVVNDVSRWFGCVESNIYIREADDMVVAAVHGCTLHGKGDRLKIGKQGMVGHVAATAQTHYAPDVSKDLYYMACEENTRSEVAIPLKAGGQVIGVFTASHPELDAFPPEQLRILQVLAGHIASAVQNARLFRQERMQRQRMDREADDARQIQQALFPKSSPYAPGFVITGHCISAGAVGGDWYDYIPLSDGRWGLVLADVSGKGMAAALLMSATRGILRSLAEACCEPGEVLTRVNNLLLNDFPMGKFVTMVYAILDPVTRRLKLANAGHLWPVIADADRLRILEGSGGLPIGFAQDTFVETVVELRSGSRLLFYSDGITESENTAGEEYGSKRLAASLQRPQVSVDDILQDVRTFAGNRPLQDDATVILINSD